MVHLHRGLLGVAKLGKECLQELSGSLLFRSYFGFLFGCNRPLL